MGRVFPFRCAIPSAALCLVSFFATPAHAQGPVQRSEMSATYRGLNPGAAKAEEDGSKTFRYRWAERNQWVERVAGVGAGLPDNDPHVGILHWDVPESEVTTGGMDRSFRTYCAEAPIGVALGTTYRFLIQAPEAPEAYGLPETAAGRAEANRRATYVRELYGRFYPQTLSNPDAARSFQIALWEIIHETQLPAATAAPFDLTTGNFRADYPNLMAAPGYVAHAQEYLKALTGDDGVFYTNPALAGLELVRLKGLPGGAAGIAAQSQFALQATQAAAGAASAADGGGLTGGAGGGGLGGGGGGGGGGSALGGGSAGNGLIGAPGTSSTPSTSSNSSTSSTSSGANQAPGTSTTGTSSLTANSLLPSDPISQPGNPTTSDDQPTTGNTANPPNPVPAPAPPGLVLALLGAVAFVGRRALSQSARKK